MNYKPQTSIEASIHDVRTDITAYRKRIEERGYKPTTEPTAKGASIFKPCPSASTLIAADAWRRELRTLAIHLPKCMTHEAALAFDGQTRYFEHQHLTPKARRNLPETERAAVESSAINWTLSGECALLAKRCQEAGLDVEAIEASGNSTEALQARYSALAGMLKAAPDHAPAAIAKPKATATEPAKAKATATPAKAAPAKAKAMTSTEALAAYNAIDVNDAKARQAFRNQHAAALGLKR